MNLLVRNVNFSVGLSLTMLRLVGFWAPDDLTNEQKLFYRCYTVFCFMFLLGTYLIIQLVDLFLIWGDLTLMTATAFVLFTNLAQTVKILNVLSKRERIQKIVDDSNRVLIRSKGKEAREIVRRCDRETRLQQFLYFFLTMVTTMGWAGSAEKNQLPLRAWYPYDTSKSPAYELTYAHQVGALCVAAYLNVGKDSLVSALVAQCRCRLKLLGVALASLGNDLKIDNNLLTPDQEALFSSRLRSCVLEHQAALAAIVELQACFSEPTFVQFTVSLIIICVTAFQLVSQTANIVRFLSMGTYLMNMSYQVFIYCYQGNKLSEESLEIAGAVYACPWYLCSTKLKRALLIVMIRTRRVAKITAGGFIILSLASFMAIIKASYSLFTLLQQVEDKK